MNVLVADDHPIVIDAVSQIIHKQFPAAKIFQAEFSRQIVPTIITNEITHLILDIQLLDGNALKILDILRNQHITIPVMIFTAAQLQIHFLEYSQWQVWAIVNKNIPNNDLWKVLSNFLTQKEIYTIPTVHFMKPNSLKQPVATGKSIFDALSKNEQQVLDLLINKQSIKEIAFITNNKPSTIATYKKRLFQKLNVQSLIELFDLCRQYNRK